jgi:hypothetical protein
MNLWLHVTEKKNGRKERKGRRKELGVVGAGLKPALLALAHREVCGIRQMIMDSSKKASDSSDSELRALRVSRGVNLFPVNREKSNL